MFILATMQLAADCTNIFLAFIDRSRAERIAFLQDVSQPVFVLKHTTLILIRLVSDLFVTYRLWIVWEKNIWVAILPISLCLGSGVTGFHIIWSFQHFKRESRASQEKWLIAVSALSLAANFIATCLTAFYLWNQSRKLAKIVKSTTSNRMPVVKIVIESTAFNAAYMIANTATLVAGTEGLETMAELGTPLVGCIFMLVIIRVCLNAVQDASFASHSTELRSMPRSTGSERSRNRNLDQHIVIDQEVFVSRDGALAINISKGRSGKSDEVSPI